MQRQLVEYKFVQTYLSHVGRMYTTFSCLHLHLCMYPITRMCVYLIELIQVLCYQSMYTCVDMYKLAMTSSPIATVHVMQTVQSDTSGFYKSRYKAKVVHTHL